MSRLSAWKDLSVMRAKALPSKVEAVVREGVGGW